MKIKIISAIHVTDRERKHLKVFLDSGMTQAKVNTKVYTVTRGTPIRGGMEYGITIASPYRSERTGQMEYRTQRIVVQRIAEQTVNTLF